MWSLYVCMHAHACMCTHMWKTERGLYSSLPCCLKTSKLMVLARLAGQWIPSTHLLPFSNTKLIGKQGHVQLVSFLSLNPQRELGTQTQVSRLSQACTLIHWASSWFSSPDISQQDSLTALLYSPLGLRWKQTDSWKNWMRYF